MMIGYEIWKEACIQLHFLHQWECKVDAVGEDQYLSCSKMCASHQQSCTGRLAIGVVIGGRKVAGRGGRRGEGRGGRRGEGRGGERREGKGEERGEERREGKGEERREGKGDRMEMLATGFEEELER